MKYIPSEWKTDDLVTPGKMNNIEQGIANAATEEAIPEIVEPIIEEKLADVDSKIEDAMQSMKQQMEDAAQLSFRAICPNNKIIYDDAGNPGVYVYIPKFRLCDVLSTDSQQVHPAFIRDGKEVDGFWMGKYQSHVYDEKAYSLPGEDPSANVTLDMVVSYNKAKGGKFHEVTAAEWAAIALWCHKNGTEPKGNNDYGRDVTETLYKAVPSMARDNNGKIQHVATGTGPMSWSHDGTLSGIWDMNGNVLEWCIGLRLVNGEIQVIPDNNAADSTYDLSYLSKDWKAINANATYWEELFVDPGSNDTVKLDWDSGKWVYRTTIVHETKSASCEFVNVSCDTAIGNEAKLLLQALSMLPDTAVNSDGIATNYNRDLFWANNVGDEWCLVRGGNWAWGVNAGVFNSHLVNARSIFGASIGSRSAYQETRFEEF